jgi:hypothetical protein
MQRSFLSTSHRCNVFPSSLTYFSTKATSFPFCLDLVYTLAGSSGIFNQSMRARNRVGIGLSYRAGIFKQTMRARNKVGIGLPYRPARLHRLAELIPWNRFLGSIQVLKFGLRPASPHKLAELIPWNRFMGSIKVVKFGFRPARLHRLAEFISRNRFPGTLKV